VTCRAASIVFILLAVLNVVVQTQEPLIKPGHWKRAVAAVEAALTGIPNHANMLRQKGSSSPTMTSNG